MNTTEKEVGKTLIQIRWEKVRASGKPLLFKDGVLWFCIGRKDGISYGGCSFDLQSAFDAAEDDYRWKS